MNRLWRRLDETVTLIAQGSGRLHAHGTNANRYGRDHESRFLLDGVRLNAWRAQVLDRRTVRG